MFFFDYSDPDSETIPIELNEIVIYYVDEPPAEAEKSTIRRYVDPLRGVVYLYVRDGVWAVMTDEVESEAMNAIARGRGPRDEEIRWEAA